MEVVGSISLAVICGFTYGSIKAHAINTLNLANAFSSLTSQKILVFVKYDRNKILEDKWSEEFDFIENLTILKYETQAELKYMIMQQSVQFAYIRDYKSANVLNELRIPYVAETHAHPSNSSSDFIQFTQNAKNNLCRVVSTIHPILAENLIKRGIPKEKVVILSDCVDNESFYKWRNNKIGNGIFYAGHLYNYKGITTFLKCAKLMKNQKFYVLGGSVSQVIKWKFVNVIVFRNYSNNVKFLGWVQHKRIPQHLSQAAVLVLPPEKWDPSASWTSPVKLGEYLSSGKPVVCSRIPALEYWIDEASVTWFQPGDYNDLSKKLQSITVCKENNKFGAQIEAAHKFDYKNKAKTLLGFFEL